MTQHNDTCHDPRLFSDDDAARVLASVDLIKQTVHTDGDIETSTQRLEADIKEVLERKPEALLVHNGNNLSLLHDALFSILKPGSDPRSPGLVSVSPLNAKKALAVFRAFNKAFRDSINFNAITIKDYGRLLASVAGEGYSLMHTALRSGNVELWHNVKMALEYVRHKGGMTADDYANQFTTITKCGATCLRDALKLKNKAIADKVLDTIENEIDIPAMGDAIRAKCAEQYVTQIEGNGGQTHISLLQVAQFHSDEMIMRLAHKLAALQEEGRISQRQLTDQYVSQTEEGNSILHITMRQHDYPFFKRALRVLRTASQQPDASGLTANKYTKLLTTRIQSTHMSLLNEVVRNGDCDSYAALFEELQYLRGQGEHARQVSVLSQRDLKKLLTDPDNDNITPLHNVTLRHDATLFKAFATFAKSVLSLDEWKEQLQKIGADEQNIYHFATWTGKGDYNTINPALFDAIAEEMLATFGNAAPDLMYAMCHTRNQHGRQAAASMPKPTWVDRVTSRGSSSAGEGQGPHGSALGAA